MRCLMYPFAQKQTLRGNLAIFVVLFFIFMCTRYLGGKAAVDEIIPGALSNLTLARRVPVLNARGFAHGNKSRFAKKKVPKKKFPKREVPKKKVTKQKAANLTAKRKPLVHPNESGYGEMLNLK